MVCNFGQILIEDCGDGVCVVQFDICVETCDGIWEEVCEDGELV